MSNIKTTKARQTHVSPGVYSREVELTYAVKSLGVTKLGLVGETLRGRAFEPYEVSDWSEFVSQFGGLDASKFQGSQYPKYELPYIAKSFLEESNSLSVCRILGLSGYNAGPAWLITASGADGKKRVVAVLRSRGDYYKSKMFNKNANSKETCACQYTAYDTLVYNVGEKLEDIVDCNGVTSYDGDSVKLTDYYSIDNFGNECEGYLISKEVGGFNINGNNLGQFTISGYRNGDTTDTFNYPVSLNYGDKNYIINVLGGSPENGTAPLWVESLYDVNLMEDILLGNVDKIDSELTFVNVQYTAEYCGTDLVFDFLYMGEEMLKRRLVGTRFLCASLDFGGNEMTVHPYDYKTNKPLIASNYRYENPNNSSEYLEFDTNGDLNSGNTASNAFAAKLVDGYTYGDIKLDLKNNTIYFTKPEVGQIYTVRQYTDTNAKRNYYYGFYPEYLVKQETSDGDSGYTVDIVPVIDKLIDLDTTTLVPETNYNIKKCALALMSNDGYYYRVVTEDGEKTIKRVSLDLNNYKSAYRNAMTPWFVSQVKGDANNININKLFRFHTINDGNSSNYEVKVSVANILPDENKFDIYVRDINDTDASPIILEKYTSCTLTPGDKNYLGLKVGTVDDAFVQQSKYVTVEIAEGDTVQSSVPCGFLGYPTNIYSGYQAVGSLLNDNIVSPDIKYNTILDESIKLKKQYFGISDLTGTDIDLYSFKGRNVYDENDITYLGNGFHLDCRMNKKSYEGTTPVLITVDGLEGYNFDTVDINSRTLTLSDAPVLSNEVSMEGCIYSEIDARKFTAYFYGGFDGWDIYRDSRTNGDEFKLNNYKGTISKTNGEGRTFERIQNAELIGLLEPGITSDYYAYLAGYRQYANPENVDINIFATPGIDYVNNTELVKEVISMIEEERADSIYVVTTPDKPFGASDATTDMYTPAEAVENLEDSDINSSYSCTYYPWVKYFDATNNVYINLPVTKDVVRNMAQTDNVAYPWFAPAGFNRGNVKCEKAHYVTKLADEDTLYNGYINAVKTFAHDGVKIWGQKTMMVADDDTMLTRIHIRRLMLRLRKAVAIAVNKIIFDPNDPTTRSTFESLVMPILATTKENRGISDYRLVIASNSVTTADRREITGQIFIKPYQALEWVNLDFVLTPEGISFSDI